MGKSVLLIEDEPNIIEAISYILSKDGWRVASHSNGATALDEISRRAPDVVILDVMLPGKTGFEVLRDLRNEDGLAHIPVLMLTARGQTKDRELAEKVGATHFMTKPFSNSEVLDKVRAMVGG
ncbi:MAG: response regulator [Paracoccaceae bacterium]|jgi:DNA-binding response OmpR family regulator|nr:response regulator [Paracoccaceae bacterium]MDP7186646.1 response regulator [Paracoccaceae bacterium]